MGRGDELAALRSAYEQTRAGHPTTVLISGEAGIGLTRPSPPCCGGCASGWDAGRARTCMGPTKRTGSSLFSWCGDRSA
ncbi:hypothetical protein [Kribbella deserti]|uniref:Sigma-54 factor interaction domain-containing protein n=1 Tax=Kribbella deserti TaxID=1926257 RepID=A0ABV6QGL3_9ACTN